MQPITKVTLFLRVSGIRKMKNAVTLKIMAVQIPGNQCRMPMQTLEKVSDRGQVDRCRVVLLEKLGAEQEQVEEHRIGHQFGDLPDGLVLDLELGDWRTRKRIRIMNAGPEQNAEARNRGARMEEFQKGRAPRPL